MNNGYYLSVLGAGQEIGSSCYSLDIGGHTLLLDCGRSVKNGFLCGPDFTCLLCRNKSPKDIENIFISHAHYDHIGYLSDVFKQCGKVPIYTSRLTVELGKVLLWDNYSSKNFKMSFSKFEQYKNDLNGAIASVNKCEFNKPIDFGSYKVTFYEAGHIPGASMIYIETSSRKILFTGDFSIEPTMLTNGSILPEGLTADTLIIDGTFAKRPGFHNYSMFEKSLSCLREVAFAPISVRVSQLTKGIETLRLILEKMKNGDIPQCRVYIDETLWNVAQAFINVGIQVLQENCFLFKGKNVNSREKAIYITTSGIGNIQEFNLDYSLHAGFDDLKAFINRYATDQVVVVHSPNAREFTDKYSLEDSCDPKLNFIYPETGETYLI